MSDAQRLIVLRTPREVDAFVRAASRRVGTNCDKTPVDDPTMRVMLL
jgi:hypothetical protein